MGECVDWVVLKILEDVKIYIASKKRTMKHSISKVNAT